MRNRNQTFRARGLTVAALALCALTAGCGHKTDEVKVAVAPVAAVTPISVRFEDVTKEAGLNFQHVNGGFGKKWLPETMGSGLAWIDYDGDGYPDLFLVNGRQWTSAERALAKTVAPAHLASGNEPTCKLYHNNGDGTFTDVTAKAGLNLSLYGMGVCVGDYDNDGRPDLYVTGLGGNHLFHNDGGGHFTDVSAKAGVGDGGWSTSAAWVDYDKDGKLDLVVCHYVKWSPNLDIEFPRNGHPTYGTPQQYEGQQVALYHNEGGGKFTNVSKKAGLLTTADGRKLQGKSLGIAICDYDGDGWPDLALANDTEPNYLYHNEGNGTFKEVGVEQGVAYGDTGAARGAMGIDACDYDRKGRESLLIGNFSNQGLSLYHNENGVFRDVAPQSGLMQPSLLSLSFGCFFVDVDNDGWPDLFVANGHVDDDVQEVQKEVEYRQRPLIFRNLGNGNFESVGARLGPALQQKIVARGAASADYDLRGALDIALATNNGPAYLFRNEGATNHAIRLELEGVKSNRSAIGAMVQAQVGQATQTYHVRSGSSYCSQSELPVTVGLGQAAKADKVKIVWPSGDVTDLGAVEAGKMYHVVEGKGVTTQKPFLAMNLKRMARK